MTALEDPGRGEIVLVTGGAGAIGSRVVRALSGHDVIVLDDLSSGSRDNLAQIGADLVFGSVTDDAALEQVFARRPTVVVHLAAFFANQNSVEHPERDLSVNGLGTLKVLERSRAAGIRRFVYASSSSIYADASGALREDSPHESFSTPYAVSKRLGEQYTNFFHAHHGLPTVVLRLFNSYGPGEVPGRYRNVIPNFLFRALTRKPLVITGTGEETRDFTYVDDVARAFLAAIERDEAVGRTLNVGAGRETSIRDLVEKIRALVGKVVVDYAPRRSWDRVSRRVADISAARQILGFEPRIGLDDGLTKTLAWLRELDLSRLDA